MNAFHKTFLVLMLIMACLVLHGKNIPDRTQNAIIKDSVKQFSNQMIAYSITRPEGNAEIFLIQADGSGKTQLTNQPGRLYSPAYSPDATKIAFYNHFNDQTWSIFLMNADGSNFQRLTNVPNVKDWSPDWSPDGRRIAFARSYSSPLWRSEIWSENPDGSGAHRLGNAEGQGPDWSPDGSRITYFNYVEGGGDIWVMLADGSNPINLTDHPAEDWWPKFSPDGHQIVFQSKRDGNHDIYVMNSDGRNPIRLTDHPADDEDPNWSPDGKMIAFISMRDGHYEVYTMNADGSNQTRITATNGQAIDPDWRPVLKQPSVIKALNARQDDFSVLKGPYLGQKPPGMTPEQFGAGVIDRDERIFAIAFSPDGKECFYTKSFKTNTIMTAKETAGRWSDPKIADFSGKVFDFEPHITLDGKRMIFGSMRPLPGAVKKDELHQWMVEKIIDGWSEPKPLGAPFSDRFCMYVSEAENGNIYYTGEDGIYLSKFLDGKYSSPEKLADTINHLQYAAHPFIAPDESYLIFDAQPQEGNADLFISFRINDETWSEPQKFDSNFNTNQGEVCAFVTRDGNYLFFSRLVPGKGDIYWVDAKIIEDLKKDSPAEGSPH